LDRDRKGDKKENKKKSLIDQQRLKLADVSEEEEMNNDELRETKVKFAKATKVLESSDDDMEVDDNIEDDDQGGIFLNPLLAKKPAPVKKGKSGEEGKDEDNEFASEDEADKEAMEKNQVKKKESKKSKLLGKRKSREDEDHNDFFANKEIEIVPQEKFDEGYSSMDSDEMAETRALAKVMLRKKARTEILDSTYSRFSTHEDKAQLPNWFVEDEARHFKPIIPITKEMIAEEKALLKAYNERPSKKVTEAKARKKKHLAKAMNKVKTKAQVIIETDINEGSKMRQIEKLYKKEKSKMKEEKEYVVNRNFSHFGKSKVPRNMKVVDKRLKKDQKNKKLQDKKSKQKGGRGKSGKGKKK
jgi:AdoMet-dependent rRNA methyltransferase SPB1